ncbi:3-hydroxyacyl-CoA dehydrogenase family protein [Marininema halotolerans]|uniref:3-hydroxybutyryl-CoA dehydrogenase n=1 Tax=Marininema halotolerans TaxID=1155944 RepID=A0A1I6UJQ2_9BACL|nr:3-hydroxyacyl-CoA dehydrogenase family protein [Marininema halotolerans]SFT01682.1 3-hydroxybutyryl-CoA dehydrogenase [Marininema halotolerans]
MTNEVLLIGKAPLDKEVRQFFRNKRINVRALNDVPPHESARVVAVIDVTTGPLEAKIMDLQMAERLVAAQVPIFSSTLAFCATRLASHLEHPERLCGFSPLQLQDSKIVEISQPLQAEDHAAWQRGIRLWEFWGKEVEMIGDEPGLVFPRTMALMVNEAAWLLTEGGAAGPDIDKAMKTGTRHPFGPLEWADRIGVDQVLWILQGLFDELGEDRYRPAPLIRRMVYAGRLGQSVGRGFYQYEPVEVGNENA